MASAKRKGLFGNCNQLFITFGILISYILGIKFGNTRVSFYQVALIAGGLVAFFEFMMLFTYETPRWLFGKNKDFHGIKVLKHLRGPDAQVMREIDHIKAVLRKSYSVMEQFREFKLRSVYQPFLLVVMLMIFQQFSGINAALFYSSTIFTNAGFKGNMVEIISALAAGLTQIFATLLSVLLVDRLGRRWLLLASSVGMGMSSLALALLFHFLDIHSCIPAPDDITSICKSIGFGTIGCVVVFIASFSIGWGPIPWTSMSELLPNRVRGLAAGISVVINWSCATVVTLCFGYYSKAVTPAVAWGSFAAVMLLSIFCVALFLPETKGRSLEEIQEDFEHGRILAIRFKSRGNRNRHSPNSQTSGIN